MTGLMLSSPTIASFDLNGAIIEMSAPRKIEGKEMTTFSGGGVRVYVQDKTLKPFSVTPPNIRAGCGGIDATFGAFSFLDMEYLGQFLQNLLNPEVGLVVGFQLALHTFCPTCEELFSKLNALANQINQIGASKCGAIQLASSFGKTWINNALGDSQERREAFRKFDELFVQPASQIVSEVSNAINRWCPNGDCLLGIVLNLSPGEKKSFIKVLIDNQSVPEPVIRSFGGSNNAEKILRAILGDIEFERVSESSAPKPKPIPPIGELNMKDFIAKWIGKFQSSSSQEGTSQQESGSGELNCGSVDYIKINGEDIAIEPLCNIVYPRIEGIRYKIETRQELTTEEKLLIASMPNPVLYLLNLASVEPGIRQSVFQNMLDYITAELASAFIQAVIQAQQRFTYLCLAENNAVDFKPLCQSQSQRLAELSREVVEIRRYYYEQLQRDTDAILKAIQLRNVLMSQIAVNTSIGGPFMYSQFIGVLK